MSTPVKRTYVSSRRTEQAESTRRAILDASRSLFTQRGYAGTTIEDIASATKVAVPTVYKAFRTKRAVLEQVVGGAMTDDPESRDFVEQEWFREQLDAPDAETQLDLIARNARGMYQRSGDLLRVVRDAASIDAEIAQLWRDISKRRRERSRLTARNFVTKRGAKRRRDLDEVADVLFAQTAPELHTALVIDAGWSAPRYERYVATVLRCALLAKA